MGITAGRPLSADIPDIRDSVFWACLFNQHAEMLLE